MTMTLNEQLLSAVMHYRASDVKRLLEQGADPNYRTPEDPQYPDTVLQPRQPLTMVMFRISDSMLDDAALIAFKEIAKLLISHGADTKPAMQMAEERYGKYNPAGERDVFLQVWDVVAIADMHSGA